MAWQSSNKKPPVTTLDASRQQNAHLWPHFLPDGKHFLYFARSSNQGNNAIYVGSLDSQETKLLLNASSIIFYAPPGHLLFVREGTLMVHLFDADRLELAGEAFPIGGGVQFNLANGRAAFAVSENGVLVYRTGDIPKTPLTWFDRDGKKLGPVSEAGSYRQVALSPDEKRVAVQRLDPQTGTYDLWLLELSRGIFSRLTFDPANEFDPVWSPDGCQIVFASNRKGRYDIYRKLLSGTVRKSCSWNQKKTNFPKIGPGMASLSCTFRNRVSGSYRCRESESQS